MRYISVRVWLFGFLGLYPFEVGGQSARCDLDLHSAPYVRVQRKRNGPPIAEKNSKEFLDLREYIHKILCVNGPAILYEEFEILGEQRTQFKKAKVKIFSHDCFIINQIRTSKAIQLRANGIKHPTLKDVGPGDIIGLKMAGIFLLSKAGDFHQTVATFLTNDKLEFTSGQDTGVTGASFVTTGVGPFCLRVDNKFDILLAGMPSSNSVCRWSLSESNEDQIFRKRYQRIFNGNRLLGTFAWNACGDGNGLGPFPVAATNSSTDAPITYDPFAIIDPAFLSNKLSFDAIESRALKKDDSSKDLPGRYNNIGVDGLDDYDDDNPPDFVITVDPSSCLTLPDKPTTLPPGCGTADETVPCLLLERALDIPPIDGIVSPNSTSPSIPPVLEKDLEWKRDVLYIVSEIFGQICEPFPPEMPYTIGRIFDFYLARAHANDPNLLTKQRNVWKYLTAELSRCMVDVRKTNYHFLWYWDNRDDREVLEGAGKADQAEGLFLDLVVPPCKAMDCSLDCQPQEDRCVLENDVIQYCASLGTQHCTRNTSACYVNQGSGVCESVVECEVMDCKGDGTTTCVPENDMCISSGGDLTKSLNSPGGPAAKESIAFDFPISQEANNAAGGSVPIFAKFPVQEVFEPVRKREYHFDGFPVNVLAITSVILDKTKSSHTRSVEEDSTEDSKRRRRRRKRKTDNVRRKNEPTTVVGECLFYYEDMGETDYELNVAIDIYWKIFTTVIGYCNRHYSIRKSETFPRLYNMFYEDFLGPIIEEWKYPKDNEALKSILSEYNSERGQRWLDVCLETAYIVANVPTFRPPRPLTIGGGTQTNYFLMLPEYLKNNAKKIKLPDLSVSCPE